MPHIIAKERALWWAVGNPVIETGITPVGALTVSGLPIVSAADENEFLGAVAGSAGDYNPLPGMGEWVEAGTIYGYGGGLVIVRQSHNRTIYAPEDTPALFSVYRADAADVLEWVANERVEVGFRRTFEGVTYQCIQAHTTQTDWTPPAVPALWAIVQEPGPGLLEWVSGEQLTYDPDNPIVRTYQGRKYQLRQNPGINIWPPPTVPALWLDIGPVE